METTLPANHNDIYIQSHNNPWVLSADMLEV